MTPAIFKHTIFKNGSIEVDIPNTILETLPLEILTPNSYYEGIAGDRFLYLIGYLCSQVKYNLEHNKKELSKSIHYKYFRYIFGSKYRTAKKILESFDWFQSGKQYFVGGISMKYSIDSAFLGETSSITILNKTFLKRLNKEVKGMGKSLTTINKESKELVDVDLSNLDPEDAIKMLEQHNSKITMDAQHRIYMGLTFNKNLRSRIRFNGENMVQLDISSSHPALFPKLLKGYEKTEEFKLFHQAIISGSFYENMKRVVNSKLIEYINKHPEAEKKYKIYTNAEKFKDAIFWTINGKSYENGSPTWAIEESFKMFFPNLWYCLLRVKKENHCNLSKTLQILESGLLYRFVLSTHQKYSGIPIFTIQDCIMVPESYGNKIKLEMEEYYENQLGYKINIKIK